MPCCLPRVKTDELICPKYSTANQLASRPKWDAIKSGGNEIPDRELQRRRQHRRVGAQDAGYDIGMQRAIRDWLQKNQDLFRNILAHIDDVIAGLHGRILSCARGRVDGGKVVAGREVSPHGIR